ncbi:hypothetical protein ACNAUY_08190 [Acinetobacter tibetensis]
MTVEVFTSNAVGAEFFDVALNPSEQTALVDVDQAQSLSWRLDV